MTKHILFIVPQLKIGGIATSFVGIANALAENGEQVSFLCQTSGKNPLLPEVSPHVNMVVLPPTRVRNALWLTRKKLHELKPDSIFTSGQTTLLVEPLRPKNSQHIAVIPTVLSQNLPSFGPNILNQAVYTYWKWVLHRVNNIAGVSQAVTADIQAWANLNPEKTRTLYNPACPSNLPPKPKTPPHPWLTEYPTIIGCGRLMPVKGFADLLHAFALIHKEKPEARLLLLGTGQEETRLKQMAAALFPQPEPPLEFVGYARPLTIFIMRRCT